MRLTHRIVIYILFFCLICSAEHVTLSGSLQVRLVGGPLPTEGRVEVYVNGIWGTVCGDYFDGNAATVVCRMLGYTGGQPKAIPIPLYGQGSGPILLGDVMCTGSEVDILNCSHAQIGHHNCGHYVDTWVDCNPPIDSLQVRLVGGRLATEGRVEVYVYGTWGTVCDDDFDDNAATVVCRMLGYTGRKPKAIPLALYGQGSGPILLDDVMCTGSEVDILNCSHAQIGHHSCSHVQDTGVDCNPPTEAVGFQILWRPEYTLTDLGNASFCEKTLTASIKYHIQSWFLASCTSCWCRGGNLEDTKCFKIQNITFSPAGPMRLNPRIGLYLLLPKPDDWKYLAYNLDDAFNSMNDFFPCGPTYLQRNSSSYTPVGWLCARPGNTPSTRPDGVKQCEPCSSGTYHDVILNLCEPCDYGQYQDQSGQTECLPCPQNTWTRMKGASNNSDCQGGTVSSELIGSVVGSIIGAFALVLLGVIIYKLSRRGETGLQQQRPDVSADENGCSSVARQFNDTGAPHIQPGYSHELRIHKDQEEVYDCIKDDDPPDDYDKPEDTPCYVSPPTPAGRPNTHHTNRDDRHMRRSCTPYAETRFDESPVDSDNPEERWDTRGKNGDARSRDHRKLPSGPRFGSAADDYEKPVECRTPAPPLYEATAMDGDRDDYLTPDLPSPPPIYETDNGDSWALHRPSAPQSNVRARPLDDERADYLKPRSPSPPPTYDRTSLNSETGDYPKPSGPSAPSW